VARCYESLLVGPIVARAGLRLACFNNNEAAEAFVRSAPAAIVGYVQNLVRVSEGNAGAFSGLEFLRTVVGSVTPQARTVIVTGLAAVDWYADVRDSDASRIRVRSKESWSIGSTTAAEDVNWLLEPVAELRSVAGDIDASSLVESLAVPWDDIRRFLAAHPEHLHKLEPRRFEELVAEIYRDHGWDVELTAQTRDGGFDIVAVRRSVPSNLRILIEAKRYDPNRLVSVGIVRSLYGIRQVQRASQVVLATTSYVSREAKRQFSSVIPWELDLLERDKILHWCSSCSRVRKSVIDSAPE
jgi:hypothetical protein